MKNYKINSETVLALGSTCCLLCIRYYESVIYYRHINIILDTVYNFVAVPLFYFFISACLLTILFKLFNTHFTQKTRRIYRLIDAILMMIYVIFIILKMIGYLATSNLPFVSIYWIIFIAWGCIFTIDFNSQTKKGERI